MELELEARQVAFVSQPKLELFFKGKKLTKYYKPDFTPLDGVVELKAEKTLTGVDDAQLLNDHHGTGKKVGYPFGQPEKLQWKRRVLNA